MATKLLSNPHWLMAPCRMCPAAFLASSLLLILTFLLQAHGFLLPLGHLSQGLCTGTPSASSLSSWVLLITNSQYSCHLVRQACPNQSNCSSPVAITLPSFISSCFLSVCEIILFLLHVYSIWNYVFLITRLLLSKDRSLVCVDDRYILRHYSRLGAQ